MNTSRTITAITAITLGLTVGAALAEDDAFNQNASRSNHTSSLSSGSGAASASYAATGRMAAAGDDEIVEPTEAAAGVKSPRDAASGQATGKRQHKPVTTSGGDLDSDNDGVSEAGVQDHNSSRSNKSASAPRDAASGQATGKRTHKPMHGGTTDVDGDGMSEVAAQDHNSTRSNKTSSALAPDGSGEGETDAQGVPSSYKAKQGRTGSAK